MEESAPPPKKMFSCDEAVIEEDPLVSSESDDAKERKLSVIAIESKKSVDIEDVHVKQQSKPFEASILPPTSTSTQTVPTEEFPEASVTSTTINQTVDVGEIAQLNVETQQDTNIAHEIETKEMRKSCLRSIKDDSSAGDAAAADEAVKSIPSASPSREEQKQSLLAHQQSTSQEEDYEVAMVSGLLPGCVAPAPTPAPSIAPLAETEFDTAEDDPDNPTEFESIEQRPDNERRKKRKEKREKEGESQGQAAAEAESSSNPEKSKRNAVCPWEDE